MIGPDIHLHINVGTGLNASGTSIPNSATVSSNIVYNDISFASANPAENQSVTGIANYNDLTTLQSTQQQPNKTIIQMVRLFVSKLFFLASFVSFGQMPDNEKYEVAGFIFKLERKELKVLTDDCSENRVTLSVMHNGSVSFSEVFCVADKEDIRFNVKGYMTVVEYYSSPVGWTIFYVFDLCKKRLLVTKRIDEGQSLNWEDFIELKDATKKRYVEKVKDLK